MAESQTPRVLIVGCGRWLRRDDQAGLKVAGALAESPPRGAKVLATESPTADLIAALDGVQLLVVVDAAHANRSHPPGTWQRIDYRRQPERLASRGQGLDVHQLSVDLALGLAEQLTLLPPQVWIYAIAAADVEYGEEVSPQVDEAIQRLIRQIPADVETWLRSRA